jgi:DegV family protein with EDD domain
MQRICILTDNTVQFTQSPLAGNDLVKIIPFSHTTPGGNQKPGKNNENQDNQEVDLRNFLGEMITQYEEMVIITLSGTLSPLPGLLKNAIEFFGKPGNIKIFDSQTTSIGLGFLVESAAKLALNGATLREIDNQLRNMIPSIYTLLYLPDLDYLARAAYLTIPQAVVGEMIGVQPVFSLENECFTPIRKVRSIRQVMEIFHDFLDEFTGRIFAALVKADNHSQVVLKYGLNSHVPGSKQIDVSMTPSLKELLGPHAVGLFVAAEDAAL